MNLTYSSISIFISFVILMFLDMKKRSLILVICTINLVGLIPEFWCITSYMWSNLLMGFFAWSLFSMNKVFQNFKFWSSHLLPLGSPIFLWSFLIILELTSQIIRPLTLSLRLTCNLMAGHVLMSLTMMISQWGLMLLMIILFFEGCVAFIQSVVFSLLIDSYKNE